MWPRAMKFTLAITGAALSSSHHGAVQSGRASVVGKCLMNNTSMQVSIHFTMMKDLQNVTYKS